MINLPESVTLPLKMDEHGNIRVSGTRITLHTLITAYKLGESAERIHEAFPTVPLADVYAVISYYLANREKVEEHIREIDAAGDEQQAFWEAQYTPEQQASTERFRKLLDEKRKSQDT